MDFSINVNTHKIQKLLLKEKKIHYTLTKLKDIVEREENTLYINKDRYQTYVNKSKPFIKLTNK